MLAITSLFVSSPSTLGTRSNAGRVSLPSSTASVSLECAGVSWQRQCLWGDHEQALADHTSASYVKFYNLGLSDLTCSAQWSVAICSSISTSSQGWKRANGLTEYQVQTSYRVHLWKKNWVNAAVLLQELSSTASSATKYIVLRNRSMSAKGHPNTRTQNSSNGST